MSKRLDPKHLKNPKVQAALRELLEAKQGNPLQNYYPHPLQAPFHAADTRIKVFLGGNRAGKSTAGAVDNLIQACDREVVPKHLHKYKHHDGPFKCRIITPDLGHTMLAVSEALRQWVPRPQLKGGSWETAYDKTRRILRFANGSHIDFMSYDQDIDKFGGVALHRVHYDEEPPGEKGELIRKQGQRRLRDYQGDEVFTFTPEFGLSWTYDALWEKRGDEVSERTWQNDRITICRATTMDNPHVPLDPDSDEELTEEEYRVKVLGEFFHIKGLVYDEFKPDRHVVDPPDVKHVKGLDIVVGIDPGYRTTAVAFIGFDKENSALIFDELYLHKDDALPENTCEQIKLISKKWGIKPEWFYIDPVARNASLQTGSDNIQAAYFRAGVPVIEANNKVEFGILEVKRRLQADPPGLFVSKECRNFLSERERYRLDDQEEGAFKVVKTNDHIMDAMRYALTAPQRLWHQKEGPKKPKYPSYGERPGFEPPASSQTFIEQTSPLGAFT